LARGQQYVCGGVPVPPSRYEVKFVTTLGGSSVKSIFRRSGHAENALSAADLDRFQPSRITL
jgi:hypothetical protein